MYHITKVKTGFQIVLVGKNGEPLSVSESFPRKQKAWGNLRAQLDASLNWFCTVQDDTAKAPEVIRFEADGTCVKQNRSVPVYIPGKNPKKKKNRTT